MKRAKRTRAMRTMHADARPAKRRLSTVDRPPSVSARPPIPSPVPPAVDVPVVVASVAPVADVRFSSVIKVSATPDAVLPAALLVVELDEEAAGKRRTDLISLASQRCPATAREV
jgi:hypothetical protein